MVRVEESLSGPTEKYSVFPLLTIKKLFQDKLDSELTNLFLTIENSRNKQKNAPCFAEMQNKFILIILPSSIRQAADKICFKHWLRS